MPLKYSVNTDTNSMINSAKYVIQFVGFRSSLEETDFISRWTPFASNFKSQGIKSIDLYSIVNNGDLTFVSRNIWDEKTYFKNFPTGMAGAGSGGGISVTQLGGYHILPDQLERRKEIQLLFLHDIIQMDDENIISCLSLTDTMPFKQVLIMNDESNTDVQLNSIYLKCRHLKQM